jgi:hypothetical protein
MPKFMKCFRFKKINGQYLNLTVIFRSHQFQTHHITHKSNQKTSSKDLIMRKIFNPPTRLAALASLDEHKQAPTDQLKSLFHAKLSPWSPHDDFKGHLMATRERERKLCLIGVADTLVCNAILSPLPPD